MTLTATLDSSTPTTITVGILAAGKRIGFARFDDTEAGPQLDPDSIGGAVQWLLDQPENDDTPVTDLHDAVADVAQDAVDEAYA